VHDGAILIMTETDCSIMAPLSIYNCCNRKDDFQSFLGRLCKGSRAHICHIHWCKAEEITHSMWSWSTIWLLWERMPHLCWLSNSSVKGNPGRPGKRQWHSVISGVYKFGNVQCCRDRSGDETVRCL